MAQISEVWNSTKLIKNPHVFLIFKLTNNYYENKKKGVAFIFAGFGVTQFFGPNKNQGDVNSFTAFLKETNPSEEVTYILKKTCFDCHSDMTRYPWYDEIAPVNHFLADHVANGKKHFNISAWNSYSTKKKDHKFEELI